MPQATHQAVLERVANSLRLPVSSLADEVSSMAAQSTKDAAADLITLLAEKGYGKATIEAADQFAVWQERLAAYYTLGRTAVFTGFDVKTVEWLDPRPLVTAATTLVVDGTPTAPQPGESEVGGIAAGRLAGGFDNVLGEPDSDGRWGRSSPDRW
jgi:hypothetical protein